MSLTAATRNSYGTPDDSPLTSSVRSGSATRRRWPLASSCSTSCVHSGTDSSFCNEKPTSCEAPAERCEGMEMVDLLVSERVDVGAGLGYDR